MLRFIVIFFLLTHRFLCADDVTIHAEQKMSCHKREKTCTAWGNAVVRKKNLSIRADRLDMAFEEKPRSIEKIWAKGHVVIDIDGIHASGHKAFYQKQTHITTLSGDIKISLKDCYVTSKDPCIFSHKNHQGKIQHPCIIFPEHQAVMTADVLFFQMQQSKNTLKNGHITSKGNVLFSTPHITIAAKNAIYDSKQRKLHLWDEVKIVDHRGIAVMDKATYELDTTKAFFHNKQDKPVKGTFHATRAKNFT